MMLLENQIPWLVVEALTEFLPVHVLQFVTDMGEKFFPKNRKGKKKETSPPPTDNLRIYKPPPHLLGLLRFSQIASMPTQMLRERVSSSLSLSRSAAELAQIGIKRTASTATWFGDMRIKKKSVCGELSLSPLFLNDITACWLFNMAALEATTIAPKWDWESDGYVVTSYLSVMAMLMDQKEDMHELRGKRVLRSIFSNTQTLAFFKRLGQHLELSRRYFATLEDIEAYKRHRPVRAAVHKTPPLVPPSSPSPAGSSAMATAAASSVSAGFASTLSIPLRTGSRNSVSFPRRSPPVTIALSVSAPAPPAANPKYHNAKADAGDEYVNGEELLQRFMREVARARVMEEIRRRRRHEDARDRRKRKARSAARRYRRRCVPSRSARHFKGPFDDDQGAKERMTDVSDDDKNDNWELPRGKLPSYR
ncbi:hypothetical protein PR202_ga30845 [Eleusine coracana subsp. coracana]|uniref:Uncharacterized protein n=1 Tax=Eleusine coracana subsp. coracana TaxID=191504 RepID=A0AAV5DQD6_ELECO|nr:hypothetical protein PR202_ga30845 [Eleusine coracana subsp. coracana]